jgi:tetratricopeptide (TPR) repeat protein
MQSRLLFLLLLSLVSTCPAADDGWRQHLELGRSLSSQGQYQEALEPLKQARAGAAESGSSEGQAIALNDLGVVHMELHDYSAAERYFRRSAAVWGTRVDQKALVPRINLAAIYVRRRQFGTAEILLREAGDLAERNLGPNNPATTSVLINLARLAFDRHDISRALSLSSRALEGIRSNPTSDPADLATAFTNLGAIYYSQGKLDEAARQVAEAGLALERLHNPQHPARIDVLEDSGWIEAVRGHYAEAEARLTQAIALAEKTFGPVHPTVGRLLHEYAIVLRKAGRKSEAKKLGARAAAIERQTERDDGVAYTVDFRTLSGMH